MAIIIDKQSHQHVSVRNPVEYRIQAASNWRTYDSYEVRAVVQRENGYRSGSLEVLVTIPGSPDENDFIYYNLSAVLESLVTHDPPASPKGSSPRRCEKMNARFSISFQEWRDGSLTDAKHLLNQHVVFAGFDQSAGQYLTTYAYYKKFLTNQPRKKAVTPDQPEWLTWMASDALYSGTARLYANVLYADGSSTNVDTGITMPFIAGDVLQFPAGYNQLGLSSNIGTDDTIGYELYLEEDTSSDLLSETMSYTFQDCHCTPLDRFFFFENGLGGTDTVRSRGEAKASLTINGQRARRAPEPFAWQPAHQMVDLQRTRHRSYDQAIGFNNREEQIWLEDLLGSEHAWRLGEDTPNPSSSGILIPINIEPGSTPLLDDASFNHTMSFKYSESLIHRG